MPTTAAIRTRELTSADATSLAALSRSLGGSEAEAQWSVVLGRPNAIAVGAVEDGRVVGYSAGEVPPEQRPTSSPGRDSNP